MSRGGLFYSLSFVNEDEEFDAVLEFKECLSEREGFLSGLAVNDRLTDAPMHDAWISGPFDWQVNGQLLSDTDDKVHTLRIVLEVFVAAFGLDPLPPKSLRLQHSDR